MKQHYIAESAISQTSTPLSLIKRQEYRSSHGKLEVNIGNEPPGMVLTSTATQSACPPETFIAIPSAIPPPPTSLEATIGTSKISGNSTQNLPRQSPKNAQIAAATTETSTATPSATLLLQHQ